MKKLNNKGFTLAELLIVVAIIGILVALAMPSFRKSLDDANINVTANNLRAAYSQAVLEVSTVANVSSSDTSAESSSYDVVCKAAIASGNIGTKSADDLALPFEIDSDLSANADDTASVKFAITFSNGVASANCVAGDGNSSGKTDSAANVVAKNSGNVSVSLSGNTSVELAWSDLFEGDDLGDADINLILNSSEETTKSTSNVAEGQAEGKNVKITGSANDTATVVIQVLLKNSESDSTHNRKTVSVTVTLTDQ